MLQLVQSSKARPAAGYFSGFVSSGMGAAKPEKFVALALSWGSQSWLQPAFSRLLDFGHACGRQSCLQAAFQAAFSIRDEFLGPRCTMPARLEAGEIPSCRSNCARLDKLKHVLHSGAEVSLGAADTSVRATSAATAHWSKRPKPRDGLSRRRRTDHSRSPRVSLRLHVSQAYRSEAREIRLRIEKAA